MKILNQMIRQFQQRHQRLPESIVLDPLALTLLAIRREAQTVCQGIPVVCQDIQPAPFKTPAKRLGIYVETGKAPCLRAFDLP